MPAESRLVKEKRRPLALSLLEHAQENVALGTEPARLVASTVKLVLRSRRETVVDLGAHDRPHVFERELPSRNVGGSDTERRSKGGTRLGRRDGFRVSDRAQRGTQG